MMRLTLFSPYYPSGLPCGYRTFDGGVVRRAVLLYARYMHDPFYEPIPSRAQMRLLCEYCCYFIHAPCYDRAFPQEIICHLRTQIEYVKLPHELANWLAGAAEIGVRPL
jgi:hypothetical protein